MWIFFVREKVRKDLTTECYYCWHTSSYLHSRVPPSSLAHCRPAVTMSVWSMVTACVPWFFTESRVRPRPSQVWCLERSKAERQMACRHTHTSNTPKGTEIYCAAQMAITAACLTHTNTHAHTLNVAKQLSRKHGVSGWYPFWWWKIQIQILL